MAKSMYTERQTASDAGCKMDLKVPQENPNSSAVVCEKAKIMRNVITTVMPATTAY
jgi:hypothetical protein